MDAGCEEKRKMGPAVDGAEDPTGRLKQVPRSFETRNIRHETAEEKIENVFGECFSKKLQSGRVYYKPTAFRSGRKKSEKGTPAWNSGKGLLPAESLR